MSEKIERILVPLDGSRLAEVVLPATATLAKYLGACICLLHIVEENPPQKVHGDDHLTTAQQAEEYLQTLVARIDPTVRVETHVHGTEEQDVALSIARHANELEAGAISLCTHGRSDLRRVVMGSIAQQVLRRVRVPVLLVRPELQPLTQIGTILTPLQGTGEGEEALPLTSQIARAAGASVYLASVVPRLANISGDQAAAARLTPIAASVALDQMEEETRDYLVDQVKQLAAQGLEVRGEVLRGDPVQRLADAAAHSKADLVVMATHGRSGLGAFWIGSVAASLVNKIAEPLLLLRIEEAK